MCSGSSGFGIGYGIGRKYRPIRVSVSVSDRNQNSGFGRSLLSTELERCAVACLVNNATSFDPPEGPGGESIVERKDFQAKRPPLRSH